MQIGLIFIIIISMSCCSLSFKCKRTDPACDVALRNPARYPLQDDVSYSCYQKYAVDKLIKDCRYIISGDNNAVVSIINELNGVLKGDIPIEELAIKMANFKDCDKALWELDGLIFSSKEVIRKGEEIDRWTNKYKYSPVDYIIEGLTKNIDTNKWAAIYFIRLSREADGEYAEYIQDKIWEIIKEKKAEIISVYIDEEIINKYKMCAYHSRGELKWLKSVYANRKKEGNIIKLLECDK